jgi:molybdate transport system ATP-binding protein
MLRVAASKQQGPFRLQVDFTAPTPGVVALFGRSGSGKTTLINIIAGLLTPEQGRVQLDDTVLLDTQTGVSVPVEERGVGYVFQDARLFPHLTVIRNLRYGLTRARGRPELAGFDEIVTLLGLASLLPRRPHQLSGGERQRVALGRALLSQPRLLLLDEPLASLDVARREEVLPYLQILRDRLRIPMVYVSHQLEEVLKLATHMVLMEGGQSLAQGTPSEVSLHRQLKAAVGLEEVGAVLEGTVSEAASDGMARVQLAGGALRVSLPDAQPGMRVRVHLLARDLILSTEPPRALSVRNALTGTVTELASDDHEAMLVKISSGDETLLARVTRDAVRALKLQAGTPVWVLVKAVSLKAHTFRVAPPAEI